MKLPTKFVLAIALFYFFSSALFSRTSIDYNDVPWCGNIYENGPAITCVKSWSENLGDGSCAGNCGTCSIEFCDINYA